MTCAKPSWNFLLKFPNRYVSGKVSKRKALLILNPRDASVSTTMYMCAVKNAVRLLKGNSGGTV